MDKFSRKLPETLDFWGYSFIKNDVWSNHQHGVSSAMKIMVGQRTEGLRVLLVVKLQLDCDILSHTNSHSTGAAKRYPVIDLVDQPFRSITQNTQNSITKCLSGSLPTTLTFISQGFQSNRTPFSYFLSCLLRTSQTILCCSGRMGRICFFYRGGDLPLHQQETNGTFLFLSKSQKTVFSSFVIFQPLAL